MVEEPCPLFYGRERGGGKWQHLTSIQPNAVLYSCMVDRNCHGNRHGQVMDPDSGGLQRFLNTALELVADTHVNGFFFFFQAE